MSQENPVEAFLNDIFAVWKFWEDFLGYYNQARANGMSIGDAWDYACHAITKQISDINFDD